MKHKQRNPDILLDQITGYLARRKETLPPDFIDDFMSFLWPRKKKHDLALMKEIVRRKDDYTLNDYWKHGNPQPTPPSE